MLIDIHLHSTHTDGAKVEISDLVAAVKEKNLDGFCLTDVHTMAGGEEAKQLAAEAGLVALVGFEALTTRGHYLVFVPQPEELPQVEEWLPPGSDGLLPYEKLADRVAQKGGVLIAAHPYDRSIDQAPADSLVQLKGIAALEVNNSRRPEMINDLAEEVAAGLGLPGVSGSDCRDDLSGLGKVACLIPAPLENEGQLIERIKAFDIWPVKIGDPPKRRPRSRGPRDGGRRTSSRDRNSRDRGRSNNRSRGGRSRDNKRGGDRKRSRSGSDNKR